jgi:hypothetical protein
MDYASTIATSANGKTAFAVSLIDDEVKHRQDAIYVTAPAGIVEIVVSGQSTPAGLGVFGQNSFRDLDVNDLGEVAFSSSISGIGADPFHNRGIFVGSGGQSLREVVRAGDHATEDSTFIEFDSLEISNGSDILFTADFEYTATQVIEQGLFLSTSEGRKTIVRTGDLMPSGTDVFEGVFDPVLTEWGAVFKSYVDPIEGIGDQLGAPYALFAWNRQRIFEIARIGDELAGSQIIRFAAESDLMGRPGPKALSINDVGQVAYTATLADGRRVVAVWTIPEPTSSVLVTIAFASLIARPRSFKRKRST